MMVSIMPFLKNKVKLLLIFAFWIVVWQAAAFFTGLEILIPTPLKTLQTLADMIKMPDFWKAVAFSVMRILIGYISGIAAGAAGALLCVRFKLFRELTSPVLRLIRAVPVASFIILALVWIKSGLLPAFICFLMVLPIVWDNLQNGLVNVDSKLIEMCEVFEIKPHIIFFKVKIPLVMPSFITACVTALGFAWKSGIAAEVICRPINSLGGKLQDAKIYLETPQVFALTAVVAVLSMIIERIIRLAVRRLNYD
ncbi:MAG: ABC transporter permease subunit [Clostridia bacterium]|nr:ABC transporter permease subunit [Clostridia bacterium]